MDKQFVRRRTAVAELVRSVLEHLRVEDGQPRIDREIDNRRWWRYGHEDFIGLRQGAWVMPADVPIVGWLDRFAEMTAVRAAYDADPVLRARVDTLIGTEFNRQARNFDWLLIEHVIQPMILTTGRYVFDEAAFDHVYGDFERGFGAEQVHMVEFRPLNGFDSSETDVRLPGGLVLKRMTDAQMSAAIEHLAVPRMRGGSVNGVRVSRFDQWALTTTRAYPVADGRPIAAPRGPAFPTLSEPADSLITALRLVCGGSVVTTHSMLAQTDDEFPLVRGVSAALSASEIADNDRPTILHSNAVDTLRATYTALSLHTVEADRSLQIAIRRLVFSGSRRADADRLIDLMTSAEALFIKRSALPRGTKGDKIARAASNLLVDDPELKADASDIETFMTTMYQARNAEIHGDDRPYPHLRLLNGAPANSMTRVLHDGERLMRRAILAVLDEHRARTTR